MEELKLSNCIHIGFFKKPHGVEGTLLLHFDAAWEPSLAHATLLVTETDGLPLPWFIADDGARITSPTTALIDLDWVEDEERARRLCGQPVYLEKREIRMTDPAPDSGKWTGYVLSGPDGSVIGTITAEDNYAGNMVLTVETTRGTRLVPFHSELMKKADHQKKTLNLDLPAGILDL